MWLLASGISRCLKDLNRESKSHQNHSNGRLLMALRQGRTEFPAGGQARARLVMLLTDVSFATRSNSLSVISQATRRVIQRKKQAGDESLTDGEMHIVLYRFHRKLLDNKIRRVITRKCILPV